MAPQTMPKKRTRHARQTAAERWMGTGIENRCWVCGIRLGPWLQVAHLGRDRSDDRPENLAFLCPTCHRIHDVGIIDTKAVIAARDRLLEGTDPHVIAVHHEFAASITKGRWVLLQGDAQKRGGERLRLRARARRASATRRRNKAESTAQSDAAEPVQPTSKATRSDAAKKAWVTRRNKAASLLGHGQRR